MKIIDEDGSIQGWFVSLCITINVFGIITLAVCFDKICDRVLELSPIITTIYLGQFASWLAYKGVKSIFVKEGTDVK